MPRPRATARLQPAYLKLLVAAGIAAPALYVAAAVLGGALTRGYDPLGEPVSALTQEGAPHRVWLDILFTLFGALSVGFGVAVLRLLGHSSMLRISALAIIAGGLLTGILWLFPMDPIGMPETPRGAGHLTIAGLISAIAAAAALAMSIGCRTIRGWAGFARFSNGMLVVIVGSGVMTVLASVGDWPTVGLWERFAIGSNLVWMLALALKLRSRLRAE